jgi:[protein-PII] uridylyltransferase
MNNYKQQLSELRQTIFATRSSIPALQKVRRFSNEIDRLLSEVYAAKILENGMDRQMCLVALGGYGRQELCPYSDIDLLVLHSPKLDKEKIASAVRFFWDMGLTLGCVVRSLAECEKILGEDISTDTALLQARFIVGDKRLFQHLESSVVSPFFARTKNHFVNEMYRSIHAGIFSPDNTLYRTEPDLKNGICTLRDCQRILWAERITVGSRTAADLIRSSRFAPADVDAFEQSYEFLLSLRCALHMLCQKRLDVLESDFQDGVAGELGFRDGAGTLMESFFKTVRTVKYFAMSFLEKRRPKYGLWGSLRSVMSATEVTRGVVFLDGILFPRHNSIPPAPPDALWIVNIFRIAQVYQATMGVELLNFIRASMQSLAPKDFRTQNVEEIFLKILSSDRDAGRILGLMHEAGALAGLVPAFSSLVCKVEYESNHEFTVDQHILLALRALDELNGDPDPGIRTIYYSIQEKLLLRLAILLHDVGKATTGDHVTSGTIIAEEMCDRLGLASTGKHTVATLVYNHLELSTLAFGRELETHLVANLAAKVSTQEILDMLYLLTVIDIRCVGYKTWTAWRASLLKDAYERVAEALANPRHATESDFVSDIGINSPFYLLDTIPEEREEHTRWLAQLTKGDFTVMLDTFAGFDRLSVLCFDRIGVFADITGCISSEGYNILSARAYSESSGKILDIFHLERDEATTIPSEKRVDNIKKKWRLLESGEATAETLLADRIRLYPPRKERGGRKEPTVRMDNSLSNAFTVLEIEAQDRFGLLYRIARCLSGLGINIVSARLSTRVDRAVDTFYVNRRDGAKILDTVEIEKIQRELVVVMTHE